MRRACLVRFRLNCQCCEAGNIFGERFGVVVVVGVGGGGVRQSRLVPAEGGGNIPALIVHSICD